MSHFAILVVGGNVEEQLQPYHEFECTGTDDQYVQEIDQTEEARKTFAEHTTTRYKDPEGNLHNPFTPEGNWDNKFWRELTPEEKKKYSKGFYQDYNDEEHGLKLYSTDWHDGKEYHTKAFEWPSEGWSEVKVPDSTVRTFADFCADYYGHPIVPFGTKPNFTKGEESNNHKYGYTLVDENGEVIKTIDRTNPNKKWDWYTVGGRWNGFFKLKPLAVGVIGDPGLNKMDSDYEAPGADRADILMKGDIDVEGMRDEAAMKASERYSLFEDATYGLPQPLSWKQVQDKYRTGEIDEDGEQGVDYEAARREYNDQPMVKALRSGEETRWYELEDFLCTREEYVQYARDKALTLFAVVKDGVWHERGSMGWWGIVSDEKDRTEWNKQFSALIDSLPDNTLLTVVDCHI